MSKAISPHPFFSKIDLLTPFSKGGRGAVPRQRGLGVLSPAGGGWGWSYIIKIPLNLPLSKGYFGIIMKIIPGITSIRISRDKGL
jgi:hypothetical protein